MSAAGGGAAAPASAAEILRQVRVVLVRPQGAANVGAVARAMKNMGLDDLALVGTSKRRVLSAATTAVHAGDLLERATRPRSLAEAVADCHLVVGTSAQGGLYRAEPESPRDVIDDLLAAARAGRAAVVFGPESHGLTRDDLRHCQRLVCIDTAPEYTSINLAQAVLLFCYEMRRHCDALETLPPARPAALPAELDRLESRMQAALLEMGFLNPQNPDRIMFVLRRMLGRAVVRPLEARVLMALARQMRWCAAAARAAKRAGLDIGRMRDDDGD